MTDASPRPIPQPFTAETMPRGAWAIVEALGHSTMVGRIMEVERFGTKMMQIEPLFRGFLLGPVLVGGSSLYRVTRCTPEVALENQAKHEWDLPNSVRATIPDHAQPESRWPTALLEEGSAQVDGLDEGGEPF